VLRHLADGLEELRLAQLALAAEARQRFSAAAPEQAGDFEPAYLMNGNRVKAGDEAAPMNPSFIFLPYRPL
jgi:hypothetical protein